jgi:hypothetical protein
MTLKTVTRFDRFRAVLVAVATVALAVAIAPRAAAQRAGGGEVLTNQSIISMSTAKLDRTVMLQKINSTKNTFDVTVNGIVQLTQAAVNPEVIIRMITMAADPKFGAPAPKTPEVLDNQSIITMVSGKVTKPVVMAKIQSTKGNYDTSSSGLVQLTQGKVAADVIKAIIAKNGG